MSDPNRQCRVWLACAAIGILFALLPVQAWASVVSALEPDYAEAILAFHDQKYLEALQHLESVLKSAPDQVEFLQLKALTLKAMNRPSDSQAVYESLLRILEKQHKPDNELAPYHFELGVLAFQAKQMDSARRHFSFAIENQFNAVAAHYFVGLIELQTNDWNSAQDHFQNVADSNAAELKAGALLYLGRIAARKEETIDAANDLFRARALVREQLAGLPSGTDSETMSRRKVAEQIAGTIEEELDAFKKSHWFGHLTLVSGYDSNVLAMPDGLGPATNNGTLKETLLWGGGYESAPADRYQLVPSYQGSINYNTNSQTAIGEYFTHTLGLFLNKDVMEPQSYGLKMETQAIWSYSTDEHKFTPFSLVGSAGPYYRLRMHSPWIFQAEAYAHPQKYFSDSLYSPSDARSGWGITPRVFFQRESLHGWWNPQISLAADYSDTSGTEFRSKTGAFEISDNWYLSKSLMLAIAASFTLSVYDVRPSGQRTDKIPSFQLTANEQLTSSFYLSADVIFVDDITNVSTYEYSRWVTSLGLNYVF